ncbi:MAG: response regulator transcription factor [Sulfitobacter sp.]
MSELSAFVLALNAQARTCDVSDLVDWAVSSLSEVIGFDSAWYGWAQVQRSDTVIHGSSTFNLPDHYYDAWTEISDQDVLAAQFVENPVCVPTYDRLGDMQSDGMEAHADRFGLKKMATAMCLREARSASFYVSAYRGGLSARAWRQEEKEFLQCAVDNISAATQLAAQNGLLARDDESASLLLSSHGATLIGLEGMRERFGYLWARSDGDKVPRWLADYIGQPGEHLLVDQELVANCEHISTSDGQGLYKMSLRPMRKMDLLTARERDVAYALSSGKSHKEVAIVLGVAPSTIRNQTQSIYAKLGVDNRVSLARHVIS